MICTFIENNEKLEICNDLDDGGFLRISLDDGGYFRICETNHDVQTQYEIVLDEKQVRFLKAVLDQTIE